MSRNLLGRVVDFFPNLIGLEIARKGTKASLSTLRGTALELAAMRKWSSILMNLPERYSDALPLISFAKSQLGQDLFALLATGFKKRGYFVEIGATNGKELSNTWLLEKKMDWTGLLVEPAKTWHRDLLLNRSAQVEIRAVWPVSGKKMEFLEAGVLSTLTAAEACDSFERVGKTYLVETISPVDLLHQWQVPREIDYLSLDTEGSELDILESFPFNTHRPKAITVEHNGSTREKDFDRLLSEFGYVQVLKSLSEFESWFVDEVFFDSFTRSSQTIR